MLTVVTAYLWLSLLLYILFGGADFGAGIIELFTSDKNRGKTRKTVYYAIGPIWEANHMWLIIAIVILFVGFPAIYTGLSVYLHIPLAIMLLGIIARGTTFIFRHYDAIRDETHAVYNHVFVWSSFITPMFLGIIAGSAVSGHINPDATSFSDAYLYGWLNLFSLSTGLFTVFLCGFLAAVFLIGEAKNKTDQLRFIRKAKIMNTAAFIGGGIVFLAAHADGIPLLRWIFGHLPGVIAITLATASVPALWYFIRKQNMWLPRVLAGFQVTMILLAISAAHFPDFIILKGGKSLSLDTHHAPAPAIDSLGWALLIGSIFILPALYYLYYSFKSIEQKNEAEP